MKVVTARDLKELHLAMQRGVEFIDRRDYLKLEAANAKLKKRVKRLELKLRKE